MAQRKAYSRLREYVYSMSLTRESQGGKPLTQQEIADATGLTQTTVSMWMNLSKPLKRVDIEAWFSLAEFVGVEPNDLLKVEEEKRSLLAHPTADFSVAAMNQ